MSRLESTDGALGRSIHTCRHVFWPATEDDINAHMDEYDETATSSSDEMGDEPLTRGTDSPESPDDSTEGIEPGRRTPRWYERMEEMVQQNRKRSVQNRNLLDQIDLRTVWIARILVAILATVLGGIILQSVLGLL